MKIKYWKISFSYSLLWLVFLIPNPPSLCFMEKRIFSCCEEQMKHIQEILLQLLPRISMFYHTCIEFLLDTRIPSMLIAECFFDCQTFIPAAASEDLPFSSFWSLEMVVLVFCQVKAILAYHLVGTVILEILIIFTEGLFNYRAFIAFIVERSIV